MKPIDIAPADLEIVQHILSQYVPSLEVRAFGSRVTWNARTTSDLDLALFTTEPLDFTLKAELREAFAQSNLPFRVDVVDWAAMSDDFRAVIEQEYVVISRVLSAKQGEISRWMKTTLGDCIVMNKDSYSPKEAWPVINYLDTGNITENRISKVQRLILGIDKIPSRARRKVQKGDIVYSTVRPNQRHYGLLKEVPKNFLASTGFTVLRAKEDLAYTDFIYWFLTQDRIIEQLHTIAEHSTSAYPSIRPTDIASLKLNLPPLPEQKAIAHILGTLDSKIELNHRMNQTLEEMAQVLFKSWFIDFDLVKTNLGKRWQPKQFLPSLSAEIYNLFPDCLAETRLGKIPRGWTVHPLRECFSLKMGQSPPGNTYNKQGEGIPFFQGRAEFGFRFPENRKFCTEPIRFAAHGDTLVSIRAPVGDMNVAREQCCIGRGIAALRHRSGSSSFTYYYATLALQQELQQFDHTGTVFGSINKKRFEVLDVIEPPSEIVNAFDALVKPLDRQILINCAEAQVLALLRSILLPRLMSDRYKLLNQM